MLTLGMNVMRGFGGMLRAAAGAPLGTPMAAVPAMGAALEASPAFASGLFGVRWSTRGGNRGNTYQPNTLKRKRRLGFLARSKSRTGRNILKRRFEKGRWFLTH